MCCTNVENYSELNGGPLICLFESRQVVSGVMILDIQGLEKLIQRLLSSQPRLPEIWSSHQLRLVSVDQVVEGKKDLLRLQSMDL